MDARKTTRNDRCVESKKPGNAQKPRVKHVAPAGLSKSMLQLPDGFLRGALDRIGRLDPECFCLLDSLMAVSEKCICRYHISVVTAPYLTWNIP